jgi:aspartyl-tRNA(Asn)/glutamyl-tRNA(Gln) amidotransferase subunit C
MNIEDLQETAALAHLNLNAAELAGAFPAFEQMLGFFAAMQAADKDREAFPEPISDLSAVSRTVCADHFRPDVPLSDDATGAASAGPSSLDREILNNAGEQDGRFIVVPNVL